MFDLYGRPHYRPDLAETDAVRSHHFYLAAYFAGYGPTPSRGVRVELFFTSMETCSLYLIYYDGGDTHLEKEFVELRGIDFGVTIGLMIPVCGLERLGVFLITHGV